MSLPLGTRLGIYEVFAKLGEGGMGEVYRARDTQVRVSVNGGDVPRWGRDGRELFFHNSGKLMAATMKPDGGALEVTAITPLFDARPPEGFRRLFYDVTPDGRFLVMAPGAGATPPPLTLTVNWPQWLRRTP